MIDYRMVNFTEGAIGVEKYSKSSCHFPNNFHLCITLSRVFFE